MVAFSTLLSTGLFIAASVNAAPMHHKRIAQVIPDSTTKWIAACVSLHAYLLTSMAEPVLRRKRLVVGSSVFPLLKQPSRHFLPGKTTATSKIRLIT